MSRAGRGGDLDPARGERSPASRRRPSRDQPEARRHRPGTRLEPVRAFAVAARPARAQATGQLTLRVRELRQGADALVGLERGVEVADRVVETPERCASSPA